MHWTHCPSNKNVSKGQVVQLVLDPWHYLQGDEQAEQVPFVIFKKYPDAQTWQEVVSWQYLQFYMHFWQAPLLLEVYPGLHNSHAVAFEHS